MTDSIDRAVGRLDRLERHLSEMLAGPRRLMRSLSKTTTRTDAMTNPNHPVHPINVDYAEGWTATDQAPPGPVVGLTKRELFAAMAMQGLLSDRRTMTDLGEVFATVSSHEHGSKEFTAGLRKLISIMSVAHADAIIAELNKETP